jgi:hypothetical protein
MDLDGINAYSQTLLAIWADSLMVLFLRSDPDCLEEHAK